jgi:hypothetical protein
MAAFVGTAIALMFASKGMASAFKADGGWVREGHFFGGPLGFLDDVGDTLGDFFSGVGGFLADLPKKAWDYIQDCFGWTIDPDEVLDWVLAMLRAPFKQIAKDLVTPGKYWSNPIDIAGSLIGEAKDLIWDRFADCLAPIGVFALGPAAAPLMLLHGGSPHVPVSGPYQLQEGERVLSRIENAALIDAVQGGGGGITIQGPLVAIQGNNNVYDDASLKQFAEVIKDKLDEIRDVDQRGKIFTEENIVRAGVS